MRYGSGQATEVSGVCGQTVPQFYYTTRKKVSSGIDRGMIDLQYIWMTTSGQSTKNKEVTEPKLDYVEYNFVTHNEIIVKSSQF